MKTLPTDQQGAVLIFILVMLLLLTLASVNMIQQNKQELMMATNARQQVQALATVEQLITQAENAIQNAPLHSACNPTAGTSTSCSNVDLVLPDKPSRCTPKANATGQLVQAPLIAGSRIMLNGVDQLPPQATIMSVSCLKDIKLNAGEKEHLCSSVPTVSSTTASASCYPSDNASSPSTCSLTNDIPNNIPAGSTWPCYQSFKSDALLASCPTEIYTIRVTSINPTTNAKRTVESRYAVDCGTI